MWITNFSPHMWRSLSFLWFLSLLGKESTESLVLLKYTSKSSEHKRNLISNVTFQTHSTHHLCCGFTPKYVLPNVNHYLVVENAILLGQFGQKFEKVSSSLAHCMESELIMWYVNGLGKLLRTFLTQKHVWSKATTVHFAQVLSRK